MIWVVTVRAYAGDIRASQGTFSSYFLHNMSRDMRFATLWYV